MYDGRSVARLPRALLLACVLLLCLLWAGAANAQYPPTVGTGNVNRSTVKKCQCVIFSGDGFAPGSPVTITDNGRFVARVTADRRGTFRHRVCFDEKRAEGRHDLLATGTNPSGGAHEVRATVFVRGDTCFRRGDEIHDESLWRDLPRTGAGSTVPALLLGFGLVTTGSGVLFVAKHRRRLASAY